MSHQYFLGVPGGMLDALAVFLTSFPARLQCLPRASPGSHATRYQMDSSVLKPKFAVVRLLQSGSLLPPCLSVTARLYPRKVSREVLQASALSQGCLGYTQLLIPWSRKRVEMLVGGTEIYKDTVFENMGLKNDCLSVGQ